MPESSAEIGTRKARFPIDPASSDCSYLWTISCTANLRQLISIGACEHFKRAMFHFWKTPLLAHRSSNHAPGIFRVVVKSLYRALGSRTERPCRTPANHVSRPNIILVVIF